MTYEAITLQTLTVADAARRAARILENGGPGSFGGAMLLQVCAQRLRQETIERARRAMDEAGISKRHGDYLLGFTVTLTDG